MSNKWKSILKVVSILIGFCVIVSYIVFGVDYYKILSSKIFMELVISIFTVLIIIRFIGGKGSE